MYDLTENYDEKVDVPGGILYRKGGVVQADWGKERGHDLWVRSDSETEAAKELFNNLRKGYVDGDWSWAE